MANPYLNLYQGSPTAGGTDGTLVSEDDVMTSPVSFVLDAAEEESGTQAVALRCANGYETIGNTTVTAVGTNAARWSFCATQSGTYTTAYTIAAAIDNTNTVFYVKAESDEDDPAGLDNTCYIRIAAKVSEA